jgi:hypothetical protein
MAQAKPGSRQGTRGTQANTSLDTGTSALYDRAGANDNASLNQSERRGSIDRSEQATNASSPSRRAGEYGTATGEAGHYNEERADRAYDGTATNNSPDRVNGSEAGGPRQLGGIFPRGE